jgi:hypothetical protein
MILKSFQMTGSFNAPGDKVKDDLMGDPLLTNKVKEDIEDITVKRNK